MTLFSMSADFIRVVCSILLFVSVDRCFVQSQGSCLDVNFKPTVCMPGPENVVTDRNILVTPNTSTCGTPPAGYCRPKPRTECPMCNASDPRLSHGPEKMQDTDFQSIYWGSLYQPTWWQSITWWDAFQRGLLIDNTVKVNLTLSMNKSYDITGDIKITFYSSKPNAIVIEKSADFGVSWTPYRYYADNCNTRFGASVPTSSSNRYQAICIQAPNTAAIQGSEIKFNPMGQFPTENFWQASIQQYVIATDIRIRLEYPWTDGNHVIQQQNFLNQYYYDVTDLQIFGRCHCNGHAPHCIGPKQQQVCDCRHETEGVSCERCKPLYNNKAWKPAEAIDKPNPCEKCQCYDHAQSCVYNSTLGFGVCTDCNHNTSGFLCDTCKDKFYRNVSLPLNNVKICLPCDCYAPGITNNGTCMQVATTNMTIGQCHCKDNFRGRKCDSCKDGFYGVTVVPIGECKACNCSAFGSFNNSVVCDQISGQCRCKYSTDGKQCKSCKDGYYSFPNSTDGQCRTCFCNQGGAYSNICNKTSGHCFCRFGITSQSCSMPMPGYFYPDADFLTMEAESSIGQYEVVSDISGQGTLFTGRGYARMKTSSSVTFYFQPPFKERYSLVTRYRLLVKEPIQLLQTFYYNNNSVSLEFMSFNVSLVPSNSSDINKHYQQLPTDLNANGNYSVTLSIMNATNFNQTIDIDSVVWMWNYENTKFFQSSNQTVKNATAECWKGSQEISMNSQVSHLCKQIEFAINTQLFNGSLACNCNSVGTVSNSSCEQYGGQCLCKPGVTGRRCDQCSPGFYNFTSNGCTACNCTTLGSENLVCDVISGQCPCKPGVVNRTCSQCRDSFYGFQTGQGCRNCSCNWDGSIGMYCGENGLCHCKNTTTGQKCDQCKPLHFNFTSNGCTPCQCDPSGSTNLQCDLLQGNCSCKQNIQGTKCNTCTSGTFNLQQSNPYGCQPCFCYNKTDQCSSAMSFYSTSIRSSFVNTTDYWVIRSRSGLAVDYSNTSTGVSLVPVNNTAIIFYAPGKYLGNQLSSYSQSLIVMLSHSKPIDAKAITIDVTVNIHSTYGTTVSFRSTLNTSSLQQIARFQLHELYSVNRVSAWMLQHTLSSVKELNIEFTSVNVSSIIVNNVELSSASNSSLASTVTGYVESCSCPANFTGSSCQQCASGYTRNLPGNGSYTDCKLCSCNSRSSSCDPQSGICDNCRLGTEGNYCERCQPGVLEPDCTRCIPGYYGLNDTSFPGCRPCECVLLNTVGGNGSICNEFTGQCDCRPNIGGRTCDRCAENAINSTTEGCQSCPECYALIQVEVHALRKDITNITNTLTTVSSISQLDTSPTFGQRLDSLTQSVTALAANATNSANIESGLATELAALNVSLDNMQNMLHINISSGINQTNKDLTTLNTTMTQIIALQDTIYRLLWASAYILQGEITSKKNSTSNLTDDLNAISSNLTKKLNQYRPIWTATNNQTLEVLQKSTNATATTLVISSDLDKNKQKMNGTSVRIQQLKILSSDINAKTKILQSNLSVVLSNISSLANRSNSVLLEAEAVNVTTNVSAAEVQTRYIALNNDLTVLNTSLNSMVLQHAVLKQVIDDSKNRSKAINMSLVELSNKTVVLANQATSAEQKATAAVQSSQNLLKEAQDMLTIVQNFNRTSTAAENMASLSLRNTREVNQTSRQAIANTNQIKSDLNMAVTLAQQSVDIARNAQYLAGNLSLNLDNLLSNATAVNQRASQSLYNDNYFNSISRNVSRAFNETIQPSLNTCKNITVDAKNASTDAKLATEAAKNASDEVAATQRIVNQTMDDFQKIDLLNATSLRQLQNTLAQHRANFTASNVKAMVAQLRTVFLQQQSSVEQYRSKIAQLKTDIAYVKETFGTLSTLEGCK